MKVIAKAYSTKRECSIQEAIYHILPELRLQKVFNMPEKWYKIFKDKCKIDELPEDSTKIFLRNMLDILIVVLTKPLKWYVQRDLAICTLKISIFVLPQIKEHMEHKPSNNGTIQ